MYRGTTPTIVYNINSDINLDSMIQIWVTFKSKTREVTKDLSELEVDNNKKTVTAELTQEETLQFQENDINTQIRFLTADRRAYASNIVRLKVNDILRSGVIYADEPEYPDVPDEPSVDS